MRATIICGAIASVFVPSILGAQRSPRSVLVDSSAGTIMQHFGPRTEPRMLVAILRDASTPNARSKRDEIADSLAVRAISYRPSANRDTAASGIAMRALNALTDAGAANPASGRGYEGALARLIKVHREARSPIVRSRALAGMLSMNDRRRALDYLRSVAISNDPTAYDAISSLIFNSRGGGRGGFVP